MSRHIRESDETDDEEDGPMGIDRRKENKIAIYGLLLAAMTNIVAVVWFAASLSSSVAQLQKSSEKTEVVMTSLATTVAGIANQVAVLQDRVMRNSEKVDKINP